MTKANIYTMWNTFKEVRDLKKFPTSQLSNNSKMWLQDLASTKAVLVGSYNQQSQH